MLFLPLNSFRASYLTAPAETSSTRVKGGSGRGAPLLPQLSDRLPGELLQAVGEGF